MKTPGRAPKRRTSALKSNLDAMPGAVAERTARRGSSPSVLIYKVMGKMFAILSVRGDENVILKCDPDLAESLREQYTGVGHRSHLDRRRLAAHFYEQVCAKLTRKQKAELASLSS